jgi:hypothetical protein
MLDMRDMGQKAAKLVYWSGQQAHESRIAD